MTDTPRTDALTARMAGELDRPMLASNHVIELCEHARDLERDLTACRAALEVAAGTLDAASIEAKDWFLTGLADDLSAAAKAARAILPPDTTGEGEGK